METENCRKNKQTKNNEEIIDQFSMFNSLLKEYKVNNATTIIPNSLY